MIQILSLELLILIRHGFTMDITILGVSQQPYKVQTITIDILKNSLSQLIIGPKKIFAILSIARNRIKCLFQTYKFIKR